MKTPFINEIHETQILKMFNVSKTFYAGYSLLCLGRQF